MSFWMDNSNIRFDRISVDIGWVDIFYRMASNCFEVFDLHAFEVEPWCLVDIVLNFNVKKLPKMKKKSLKIVSMKTNSTNQCILQSTLLHIFASTDIRDIFGIPFDFRYHCSILFYTFGSYSMPCYGTFL